MQEIVSALTDAIAALQPVTAVNSDQQQVRAAKLRVARTIVELQSIADTLAPAEPQDEAVAEIDEAGGIADIEVPDNIAAILDGELGEAVREDDLLDGADWFAQLIANNPGYGQERTVMITATTLGQRTLDVEEDVDTALVTDTVTAAIIGLLGMEEDTEIRESGIEHGVIYALIDGNRAPMQAQPDVLAGGYAQIPLEFGTLAVRVHIVGEAEIDADTRGAILALAGIHPLDQALLPGEVEGLTGVLGDGVADMTRREVLTQLAGQARLQAAQMGRPLPTRATVKLAAPQGIEWNDNAIEQAKAILGVTLAGLGGIEPVGDPVVYNNEVVLTFTLDDAGQTIAAVFPPSQVTSGVNTLPLSELQNTVSLSLNFVA